MSLRPAVAAVVALALGLACAGCGLGPGAGTGGVSLRVTRDFGTRAVKTVSEAKVSGSQSDMQLLQHHFSVTTRYGGGFVQSIDGHAGTSHHYDWFFYVNGIEATKGAAAVDVDRGDHIWFDLHDWRATQTIPAVVGSFPEPFAHGTGGKRYPTTLECGQGVSAACDAVAAAFGRAHVPISRQLIGTGSGPDTLSVNVARWPELAPQVAGELVDHGPGASGVYARFSHGGSELDLLDPAGHVVRRLGAGAGLIAATGDTQNVPTWLVGGTDTAGVLAAARALTPQALDGHFALAVQGAHHYPVPITDR